MSYIEQFKIAMENSDAKTRPLAGAEAYDIIIACTLLEVIEKLEKLENDQRA